jgi:hypothetical protein
MACLSAFGFLTGLILLNPRLDARSTADIGTVGTSAAVEANPYNSLAGELQAKESELSAKEDALNERELGLVKEQGARRDAAWNFIVAGGAILLALVLVNLWFDIEILREERRRPVPNA